MKVFEKCGPHNTDEACRIAIERAMALQTSIVAPTTEGGAGVRLCQIAAEAGFVQPIVIVTHAYGSRIPGENLLKPERREEIRQYGATLVTAAHALSGVERAISTKFSGLYPAELMAQTLRMFSQGVKVTVEIGCMALDAGAVPYAKPIVCMGGTGRGLDTAVVVTPAHANCIFATNIHEILCMPY